MSEECKCSKESEIRMMRDDIRRGSDSREKIYLRIEELSNAQAVTNERYNTLLSMTTTVATGMEEIKNRPIKRWESLVASLITGAVGVLIGYLVNI